jgi:hypothetical protein
VLVLALGIVLWVLWTLARFAYYVHMNPGPLNSSGGQPPTACTVETEKEDCGKLVCISHVWYCDHRGAPICSKSGMCTCFYGCL